MAYFLVDGASLTSSPLSSAATPWLKITIEGAY